ncbi:MAG: hypothetical protein JW782_00465 [Candidatus Saganbacteria bacterium]|nr:hypothetical protein [Candidatus Saganbacteria bacterium]
MSSLDFGVLMPKQIYQGFRDARTEALPLPSGSFEVFEGCGMAAYCTDNPEDPVCEEETSQELIEMCPIDFSALPPSIEEVHP